MQSQRVHEDQVSKNAVISTCGPSGRRGWGWELKGSANVSLSNYWPHLFYLGQIWVRLFLVVLSPTLMLPQVGFLLPALLISGRQWHWSSPGLFHLLA